MLEFLGGAAEDSQTRLLALLRSAEFDEYLLTTAELPIHRSPNSSRLKNLSIRALGQVLFWKHRVALTLFGNQQVYEERLRRLFSANLGARNFEVFRLLAWILLNLCKKPLPNRFLLEDLHLFARLFAVFADTPPEMVPAKRSPSPGPRSMSCSAKSSTCCPPPRSKSSSRP